MLDHFLLVITNEEQERLFTLKPDGTSTLNREKLDEGAQLFFDKITKIARRTLNPLSDDELNEKLGKVLYDVVGSGFHHTFEWDDQTEYALKRRVNYIRYARAVHDASLSLVPRS
jgi:hypothetical protein